MQHAKIGRSDLAKKKKKNQSALKIYGFRKKIVVSAVYVLSRNVINLYRNIILY